MKSAEPKFKPGDLIKDKDYDEVAFVCNFKVCGFEEIGSYDLWFLRRLARRQIKASFQKGYVEACFLLLSGASEK
tara:strand:+ start:404 stop:628 length:225 start_codon:yes stop_codon:yes gene_type:complete